MPSLSSFACPRALSCLCFLPVFLLACGSEEGGEELNHESGGQSSSGGTCSDCETSSGAASSSGGAMMGSGGAEAQLDPHPEAPYIRDCQRRVSTTSYDYGLKIAPSNQPPAGLKVEETPLFVALGIDDNDSISGMNWFQTMLEARDAGASFYLTSSYSDSAGSTWKALYDAGFEMGYHTHSHNTQPSSSAAEWKSELDTNEQRVVASGIPSGALYGSRAPKLEYNDAMLAELKTRGVWYDCSIEEGFDSSQDGSNLLFPYTLDEGSPGHEVNRGLGIATRQFPLSAHSGLFELPVYALIVPDDTLATKYSFQSGLRQRIIDAGLPDFVEFGYKITGFDWNLISAGKLSGPEILAIMKYNFDLRRQGNRAPFLFGAHPTNYSSNNEYRSALTSFIDYVQTFPETRVVSYKEVFDFMREPKVLDCY